MQSLIGYDYALDYPQQLSPDRQSNDKLAGFQREFSDFNYGNQRS